jgi:uncharacterized protein with FMN-binding domain
MSNLLISVAAEFIGKRAFQQADTATEKLGKSVKNLARNLGVAFSTAAVVNFAKVSVRAAADDQRAQQQLALALKNVGIGRDAASAEGYIQRLQSEFSVVDDKLRPAYQLLAIATRDSFESQRLMNIAMDVAAANSLDLNAVSKALSKAYLGNNTALSKLGIAISKADLKTKSFKEISDKLAATFAGAAKTSADSFAGSIDKLSVATNNAKEILGTSLINALTSLSKDKSMSNFATDIENASKSMANFIDSIVYLKGELAGIPGAGIVKGALGLVGNILGRFSPQRAAELLKEIKGFQGMGNISMSVNGATNSPIKKLTTVIEKLTAAQLAQIKLDKAKAMFDLKKIGIAAALKGNITGDSRNRLLAMQAIENGNSANAALYSSKINPNAATSVININAGTIVGSKEALIDAVRDGLETIRRRSGAGVGR